MKKIKYKQLHHIDLVLEDFLLNNLEDGSVNIEKTSLLRPFKRKN